ncbi:zinc finger protein 658B-like [Toxorhynchites rutilus septentrionalis]|uniref:zinc finger protein 658B-like n=1 Tax=Toxorhynchites rutilus septentrionalis TaxID=329112 RepID=UPI0024788A5A|nr:zinc finger protein 658B-like [Toxorhynchites rutilus septentrionalis]
MEDEILIVPSGGPESYCRLCLSESNVETLLFPDVYTEPSSTLIKLIRRYVRIRLPLQDSTVCAICNPCRMMLEEINRFTEHCLRCDVVLRGENATHGQAKDDEAYSEMGMHSTSGCAPVEIDGSEDESALQVEDRACPTCGLTFDTVQEMRTHARTNHGEYPSLYECPKCPSKFKNKSGYTLHLKSHRDNTPFQCNVCDSGFYTRKYIRAHKAVYHNDSSADSAKLHKCIVCSRIFASEAHLSHHLRYYHEDDAGKDGVKTRKTKRMRTIPTEQVQPMEELLITPMYPSFSGEIREESFEIPVAVPPLHEEPFEIPEAVPPLHEESFEIPVAVPPLPEAIPQALDNDNKPFQCPDCNIGYHFIGSLKRHMRDVHRRFYGPRAKLASQINMAQNHQSTTVTAQTTLEPVALVSTMDDAKWMKQNGAIEDSNIHSTSCSEEVAFKDGIVTQPCSVHLRRLDDKAFPPIPNLEIPLGKFYHALQVQAQQSVPENALDDELLSNYPSFAGVMLQKFVCEICRKPYKSRMALRSHMARHNDPAVEYKCPICDRTFPKKESLNRHIPLHTNEFPHPCDECPLGFVRRSALVKHKQRYHGEDPHPLNLLQCLFCPRVYANLSSLRAHMTTLHDVTENGSVFIGAEG